MSERAEQIATEGFLDFINSVFRDNYKKKNDPNSWKRGWTSTRGLIKILTNTYGNQNWLEHRGRIAADTVNMSDMAANLLVNNTLPENLTMAIEQNLNTVKKILYNWNGVINNRCTTIQHALNIVQFDYNNTNNWPFYSNKLGVLLRNLKPLNLIKVYHDFDGLMGTVAVLADGTLSIGKDTSRSHMPIFPTLALDEIPQVTQAVINTLNYTLDLPKRLNYSPDSLYNRVEVYTGKVDNEGMPTTKWVSFMGYLQEHNAILAHLLDADYLPVDEYDYDENDSMTNDIYSDGALFEHKSSLQPFYEIVSTLYKLTLAVEYWMYRSVK